MENRRLPNFLIIGAQKSASTFLQLCLSDHPQVYMPDEEIPFFESPDYEQGHISDLERIFDKRSEKCLGIKRPNYIGKPEVPKRITSHLPKAKIIAILRNPIDRAISAYYHNINYGFIPPENVEAGMRKILNQISFSKKYQRSLEIIEFGYYYKYLSEYKYFLKKKQFLVFLHEDLLNNPLDSIQETYKFLGISHNFIPKSLNSQPQKVIYNLSRLKFLRLRNRFVYDYNLERDRLYVKNGNLLDKVISKAISMADEKILSRFLGNNRPKISQELQQILYNKYRRDIEALEDLINRDLTCWRPKETT